MKPASETRLHWFIACTKKALTRTHKHARTLHSTIGVHSIVAVVGQTRIEEEKGRALGVDPWENNDYVSRFRGILQFIVPKTSERHKDRLDWIALAPEFPSNERSTLLPNTGNAKNAFTKYNILPYSSSRPIDCSCHCCCCCVSVLSGGFL
jgi:hypothetical protein